MKISSKLMAAVAGVLLFGSIGLASAQTTTPSSQGLTSVQKNLAKDKDGDGDSKGLLTAQQRIERNQKRHALHKAEVAERKADRPERPMRPEHPERPGR